MGGATNIGSFLRRFGPGGLDLRIAGLCDAGEEDEFRRAIIDARLGAVRTRDEMELLGFFVCDPDLEGELIRGLGPAGVERVLEAQGEFAKLRTFQRQPAWRGRPIEHQLRRFMGTFSGRKINTAARLVEELDPDRAPRPLARLLGYL